MKKQITAFYLETLLMILVFVAVILVLTMVFGGARVQSVQADRLTEAVNLAQSAAEAVAASDSPQMVYALLDEDGTGQQNDDRITVFHEDYRIDITWVPEGELVTSTITVSRDEKELYQLTTAVMLQEAKE